MVFGIHHKIRKTILLITITCNDLLGRFFALDIANKESKRSSFSSTTLPIEFSLTSNGIVMNMTSKINQATRTISCTSVVKNIQTLSGRNLIFNIFSAINVMHCSLRVSPCCTNTPTTSKIIHLIVCFDCFNTSFSSRDFLTKFVSHLNINILSLLTKGFNNIFSILQSFSTNIHLKLTDTKVQFKIKILTKNFCDETLPRINVGLAESSIPLGNMIWLVCFLLTNKL